MVTATGWTYEYISKRVTMTQYNRLMQYWSKHPPVHIMVAAYLGVKPQEDTADSQPSWKNESFDSMLARWNSTPGLGMR